MANKATGTVDKIFVNTKTRAGKRLLSPTYVLIVDDVKYQCGFDDPGVDEGDNIELEYDKSKYGNEVVAGSVKKVNNTSGGGSVQMGDKQAVISWQAARNSAIEMVKLANEVGALPLSTKKAEQYDQLLEYTHELTQRYFTESMNPTVEEEEEYDPFADSGDDFDDE